LHPSWCGVSQLGATTTSVSGSDGCLSWQEDFGYDANGNQTSRYAVGGMGSTVSWYSYNLPNTINLGGSASQFFYTPNRARWKQVANYGGATETTIYVGGILEKLTRGGVTEYRHRIPAGSSSTAVYVRRSSGSSSTYYTTRDHLGSSTVTMDSNGASLVNLSFGAYGKRRGAARNDVLFPDDCQAITALGRRGLASAWSHIAITASTLMRSIAAGSRTRSPQRSSATVFLNSRLTASG
jgi:hypothetical protein